MNKNILLVVLLVVVAGGLIFYSKNQKNNSEYSQNKEGEITMENQDIKITPIEHATMVLNWQGKIIYTDPVGGAEAFSGQPEPDIILLTDIHGDHLNKETLQAIKKENSVLIMPQAVADELGEGFHSNSVIMANGDKMNQDGYEIEAMPMYNLPESEEAYHVKGRGNGYVVEYADKRVYISGDTSDIAEMRALENIDIAFVCMNLPYTMDVESAADAVLDFAPRQVHAYHYRGQEGLSDIGKFKEIVNQGNPNIEVGSLNWYPGE